MKRERLIILDALRAMAGLTVPLFHICENLGRPPLHYESVCGHGYLAVEFFLLLMGYMLAYAYDSRWSSGMGVGEFFRRRLVRLHPLVISGVILGGLVFCVQSVFGFSWMSWLQGLPAWKVALLALWSMTMVPVVGVGLINPFNACSWTLYYEYAGNILYALGLRKLGKLALAACVAVSSLFWLCYVMHVNLNGVFGTHLDLFDKVAANAQWSIVCGWGDSAKHFYGGFVRLALPLFLGLLLARLGWRIQLKKGAFSIAVAVFALILYMPFPYELGGEGHYWVNALFEFLVVTVVFPLLILVGVGSRVELPSRMTVVVTYLAELSYPLYMSHFMFTGVFWTWVKSLAETSSTASIVLASAATYLAFVAIAALTMQFWDRPIQRFLSSRPAHKGVALTCLLAALFAFPASAGDAGWTGRERHIAVVNPVCRPADDPDALSLRGTWTFVPCKTGGYRQSQMPKGRTWHWEDDPSIVHDVSVPGCWEASGAIPGTGMSSPWTCWDKSPLLIHGLHVGAGWYKRMAKIPAAWKGKRIWFKPGWVNSVGSFWVNGEAVTMEYDNYCGTYKYDVTDLVTPCEEALVVVEAINDFPSFRGCFNFVNRWGGILRAPEFEATPKDAWIDDAWVRGDFDAKCAEAHVAVSTGEELKIESVECRMKEWSLRVAVDGNTVEQAICTHLTNSTLSTLHFKLAVPLAELRPWSPESPNLYTAKVELVSSSGETIQVRYERFGVRKFERRGSELFLNNRPFFVRGAGWHDINPIEGAAPCDREHWLKAGRRVKEAGFNYIRLHTQARSPEFFEACDELGLMVQPELPYYTDVPGDRQKFDPLCDAEQLYLAYRRHPSFATYSGGNEGSFGPVLGKRLYDEIKARDPDRLVMGQDCYPSPAYNKPGTSDFAAAPTTVWPRGSFRDDRPFIAHEYMNLSVKLDYRLEEKFTGVWVPPITRKFREDFLAKSGLSMATGDRLQESQHALQAAWRKYGIESARLDPECDGYSFWSLQDVCVLNKGTPAAQALFDPFWGDKRGGETAAQVAVYNSPSCVLLRDGSDPERWEKDFRNLRGWHNLFADSMATNRVRQAGETLRARFYFAHYGASDLQGAMLAWRLTSADGRVLASGEKDIGSQPVGGVRQVGADDIVIPEIATATKATLAATITSNAAESFSNSWNYWLFPKRRPLSADAVACADELRPYLEGRYENLVQESAWRSARTVIVLRDSALEAEALASGKNVISLSGQFGEPNILLGWWWMGSQMGSVLNDHPWLEGFPHDGVFSPLFFRIAKSGLKLPVAGVTEKDIVMVGEGAEACYLYLAETASEKGGRICHIAGLDVLSGTPEGTMILDGAIRRCRLPALAQ